MTDKYRKKPVAVRAMRLNDTDSCNFANSPYAPDVAEKVAGQTAGHTAKDTVKQDDQAIARPKFAFTLAASYEEGFRAGTGAGAVYGFALAVVLVALALL